MSPLHDSSAATPRLEEVQVPVLGEYAPETEGAFPAGFRPGSLHVFSAEHCGTNPSTIRERFGSMSEDGRLLLLNDLNLIENTARKSAVLIECCAGRKDIAEFIFQHMKDLVLEANDWLMLFSSCIETDVDLVLDSLEKAPFPDDEHRVAILQACARKDPCATGAKMGSAGLTDDLYKTAIAGYCIDQGAGGARAIAEHYSEIGIESPESTVRLAQRIACVNGKAAAEHLRDFKILGHIENLGIALICIAWAERMGVSVDEDLLNSGFFTQDQIKMMRDKSMPREP